MCTSTQADVWVLEMNEIYPQELPSTKEKIEDQIEMCFHFFGVTEIYIVWYFGEE